MAALFLFPITLVGLIFIIPIVVINLAVIFLAEGWIKAEARYGVDRNSAEAARIIESKKDDIRRKIALPTAILSMVIALVGTYGLLLWIGGM